MRRLAWRNSDDAGARSPQRERFGVVFERHQGSDHAEHLRRLDHHGRLSADPHAHRSGGKDVRPDGVHRSPRAFGRDDSRAHLCSRGGRDLSDRKVSEKENRVIGFARRIYEPLLQRSLRATRLVVARRLSRRGRACSSPRKWGANSSRAWTKAMCSSSRCASRAPASRSRSKCRPCSRSASCKVPEVKEVFTRIGTAEVASDPMPPNTGDCYVMLKPRSEWPDPAKSKAAVVEDLTAAAAEVPGSNYEVTQPIQMRFNELISGVRSDVGVKIFGDDMEVLRRSADASRESSRAPSPATTQSRSSRSPDCQCSP